MFATSEATLDDSDESLHAKLVRDGVMALRPHHPSTMRRIDAGFFADAVPPNSQPFVNDKLAFFIQMLQKINIQVP